MRPVMRMVPRTIISKVWETVRWWTQLGVIAAAVCSFVVLGCQERTEMEQVSPAAQQEAESTGTEEPAVSAAKLAEALVAVGWAEAGVRKIQSPWGSVGADGQLEYDGMLNDEDIASLRAIGLSKSDFVTAMKATMTGYNLNEYGSRVVDCLAEME